MGLYLSSYLSPPYGLGHGGRRIPSLAPGITRSGPRRGAGTGNRNRTEPPHYPETVTQLHAVDPANLLPKTVTQRSTSQSFPIRIQHVTAESLPYADRSFDFVVSTWTLCTIPDPVQALQEVRRVLKPGGTFLFLEHGRSEDREIAAWQDRLNPIQNIIGCGCNLNRQIDQLITQAGLKITHARSIPHAERA